MYVTPPSIPAYMCLLWEVHPLPFAGYLSGMKKETSQSPKSLTDTDCMAVAPLREGTWQNNFLSTLVIQPSYIVWTAKDSGQIPEYSYILFFIEEQPFLRALTPGLPSPAQVQPVVLLLPHTLRALGSLYWYRASLAVGSAVYSLNVP